MAKRKPMTAQELMEQLKRDPDYRRGEQQRERERAQGAAEFRRAAAPVLEALAAAGVEVERLEDLQRKRPGVERAVPVLVEWLGRVERDDVKEAVVRALSVPWARPAAAAPLVAEFRAVTDPTLKWAIGNALAVVADETVLDDLIELVRDAGHGKSREMLPLALATAGGAQSIAVLRELLQDDEVAGHAVMALGKLRAGEARTDLEPFLEHPKAWVRKEARQALSKLSR